MDCKNHPGLPASDRCAGCAEAFCGNCLVSVGGKSYCASCKVMAAAAPPPIEMAMTPCPEAKEALKYSLIGLLCFGIILEPIAISKALKAKRMMQANPRLSGSGQATAALIIGIVGLALWVLGLIARVSGTR